MNRLEVKNISKNFGGVRAVDDFSMTLKDKDIVSIIGPNGAGKTTIFNLISGVYKIDGGEVYLDGGNISQKKQHEIATAGIARTFQNIRLFKGLSVLENVMTAKDPSLKYNIFDSLFYTPRRRKLDALSKEECMHYLEVVGLKDLRNERPESLPYGTQRKLEIARALATNPKVLLLDEPAAGLNPSEVAEFIELIRKLRNDYDFSILLIEHRMQVVMELSRWIYVQNFGKTLAEGTPKDIQNNAEVTKAYIGEEDEICLV
jgi:branched-chain amino acid transport system ATP-binding protein